MYVTFISYKTNFPSLRKGGEKGGGLLKICIYLALGIAAGAADKAAFLIDQQIATLRALSGQVFGQAIVFWPGLTLIATDVLFQHAGNGIGTGEDGLAFFPGN